MVDEAGARARDDLRRLGRHVRVEVDRLATRLLQIGDVPGTQDAAGGLGAVHRLPAHPDDSPYVALETERAVGVDPVIHESPEVAVALPDCSGAALDGADLRVGTESLSVDGHVLQVDEPRTRRHVHHRGGAGRARRRNSYAREHDNDKPTNPDARNSQRHGAPPFSQTLDETYSLIAK